MYQSIISDVIDASRVDFEEGGVDESVLEELKLVRCDHISIIIIAVSMLLPIAFLHPASSYSSLLASHRGCG